jgi:hypothetical protein
MSYIQYQRPCFQEPQPLEFNAIDIRKTVSFNKLQDPYEYKYECYMEGPHLPPIPKRKRVRVVEGFDFHHDLVDYKPTNCMYTTVGSYICVNQK